MTQQETGTLIVGSGFTGLGMAAELRRRGDEDFVILERALAVAGTWRDNSYPGCACDVESHLYSFSFERKPDWSRSFAPWNEIRDYIEDCTDKYDLRRHVHFDADVATADFDESTGTWTVTTQQGATYVARHLVLAGGGLSNPSIPELPGIERFEGTTFHSAQWNHDYDLKGKRVAVIGTGASAIQFVPAIQPEVEKLHLFQRTAPWVMPKADFAYSKATKWLLSTIPLLALLYRLWIYWRNELRVLAFKNHSTILRAVMPIGRRHINAAVKDPALREKLTPNFTPGCKRMLMSNNYYQSLNQPNTDVITDGVAEVRPHSIVTTAGDEIEVDAILYGTGFRVHDNLGGIRVTGRRGMDLATVWKDGAEAYLGNSVPGFPNLHVVPGPNTGLGHTSMIVMIESQINYVSHAIRVMRDRGLAFMDVKREVHDRYNAGLQRVLKDSVWNSGCQSWYRGENGKIPTIWPGFTWTFRLKTRRVKLSDYELVPLPAMAGEQPAPANTPEAAAVG